MRARPEREEVRRLYQEGSTYNQLAKQFNLSKSTVSKWCNDLAQVRLKDSMTRTAQKSGLKYSKRIKQSTNNVAESPYEGFTYDVYTHNDGIVKAHLFNKMTGERSEIHYDRLCLAMKLGRRLTKLEQVLHLDGDKSNNDFDNIKLKPIERKRPKSYYVPHPREKKPPLELECVICESKFVHHKHKETCSKECKYILIAAINSRGG